MGELFAPFRPKNQRAFLFSEPTSVPPHSPCFFSEEEEELFEPNNFFFAFFHMLFFFRTDSYAVIIIGASYFVNGWSSLVSHASTDEIIPSIIDRWSIVWTGWLACAFTLDELAEQLAREPLVRRWVAIASCGWCRRFRLGCHT